MKIESPMLGTIEITEDRIIDFPDGLPGFEQCKRFVILHEESDAPSVYVLQSTDDPQVAFSITSPVQIGVRYEFSLTDDEAKMLELAKPEDVTVAIIVRKGDENDDNTPAGAGLRANFMAPVVINTVSRKGLQKVINRLGCEITLRAEEESDDAAHNDSN